MTHVRPVIRWVSRSGKRIAVSIVGFTLLVAGLALLLLPGPGLLLIIAGLAVLASEYAWARRALAQTKRLAKQTADRVRGRAA